MSAFLYCCPVCSVAEPPGVNISATQHRNYYKGPTLWRGRRSGRFWLTRSVGCVHGPLQGPESSAKAEEVAGPWNAWAGEAANEKAERLKFAPDQKARFLHGLGIGRLEEVIAAGEAKP